MKFYPHELTDFLRFALGQVKAFRLRFKLKLQTLVTSRNINSSDGILRSVQSGYKSQSEAFLIELSIKN